MLRSWDGAFSGVSILEFEIASGPTLHLAGAMVNASIVAWPELATSPTIGIC